MELITGNKFKKICHYSLDEFGFVKHSEPKDKEVLRIFVKIDFIHQFFNTTINRPYEIITHNGDIPVDNSLLIYMDDVNLLRWYGQNINTVHHKLQSIPIGIANEIWPHGNENIFLDVVNQRLKKDNLIYANFDVNTNKLERSLCLSELNKRKINLSEKVTFKNYLEELSKSYFVISPNGNGIDCHKTWEALYLKTIPIITKSINSDFFESNLPIIVIDSWASFDPSGYDKKLYDEAWGSFDPSNITVQNSLVCKFGYNRKN